ncbi:hypothetical protein GEV33_011480 [Tenebrio molitor]|jgi:hypothetical protein|uniref:Uncharacterized protein n=1 Tax=Tenebrio molitor TaxID=7067 RepID=A0A8J6L8W1_TENMO|nr:hypothetical protein GEV33_011480 [Tenebrio molitor]
MAVIIDAAMDNRDASIAKSRASPPESSMLREGRILELSR